MPAEHSTPQFPQLASSVAKLVQPTPGQQTKVGPASKSQKPPIRPTPQFVGVPLQTP
jgi:hypothetical protein